MSREPMHTRLATALLRSTVVGIAAALSLAGCAAGQITQTGTQVAAVNGARADIGPISLNNAVLAYPGGEDVVGYTEGDDVPLLVTITNTSDQADQLIAVTTPAASRVLVTGTTIIPSGVAVSSAGTGPDDPLGTFELESDPSIEGGELFIVLADLTKPIRPGLNTPVTFLFRNAGRVTLPVPIDAPVQTRSEPAEDSPPGDE